MKRTLIRGALLLAGIALVVQSCGDPSPLGPSNASLRPHRDLLGLPSPDLLLPLPLPLPTLASCTPMAADTVSQVIGPSGGVMSIGPHTFTVPPGALDVPVTITAVAPSDTVNVVFFEPEGLQFEQPATLTLSYANCWSLLPTPRGIVHVSDQLVILHVLRAVADPSSKTVSAHLRHFSGYAVDW